MRLAVLFATLLAAPLAAQDSLDAAGFDAAVTGFTVTYNDGFGNYAGVEAYHPHNRVTWVADGGTCQKGRWYQEGSEICFLYDGQSFPVCWTFYYEAGNLMAATVPGSPTPWQAIDISTDPISCNSPFVGS